MDGIRAWGAPEPAALAAFYRRSELEILSRRISYCAWSAWLVYFICIDLSYPVFAQLRGDSSRRAEFLLQHILTVGAQVLPLVLFFTGIEIWNYSARLAVLVFAMAYLTRIGCLRWQVKITQMLPQPLTTGELRDRVFALARKAGGENSAGICDARRQGRDGECLRSSEQHGDLHRLLVAAAYEAGGGCGGGARTHAS